MRVIVSMTTIAARNGTLGPTLASLAANQIHEPDEILIYITPGCEYPATPFQNRLVQAITVRGSEDYGPVTKLGAVRDHSIDPDDLIVTVDDDIVYHPNWLAMVVSAAHEYPNDAIGFSGWNVGSFLDGTGSFEFLSPPGVCDVLEGWAGAAYRKRFFDGVDILNSPPAFKFVDDVWISSQLAKKGIVRRMIAFPQARPADQNQQGLHTRHDFRELNRLAVIEGFSR